MPYRLLCLATLGFSLLGCGSAEPQASPASGPKHGAAGAAAGGASGGPSGAGGAGGGGAGGGDGGGAGAGSGGGAGQGAAGGGHGGGVAGHAGGPAGAGGGASAGGIQIIVEPSDNGSALVKAIFAATKSVHMTMYLLTSSDIIDALVKRKQAGLDVKVLLNQTFPGGADNTTVFAQLTSAGIEAHWAPSGFSLTHEKCFVLDGQTAWIMTMNATGAGLRDNREYLAVDTIAADVAEAEAIFEADFGNVSYSAKGDLVVAPDNASARLVALTQSAKKSLDMEAEELSDTDIVAAMTAAADRGVAIRVVLSDHAPSQSQQAAIDQLKKHGVKPVSLSVPYVHAKSLVVDGASAYVGSENFTYGSVAYNRELGVIFSTPSEVAKVLATTAKDYAGGAPL